MISGDNNIVNEKIVEATKLIQDMTKEKQQRAIGYIEGLSVTESKNSLEKEMII